MNSNVTTSRGKLGEVQYLQIVIHASFIGVASIILIVMKYCTKLRYYDHKTLIRYPGHKFKWSISGLLLTVLFFSVADGILTDLTRNATSDPYLYIPQLLAVISVVLSLVYYHHMEHWNRPHLAWWMLLYWVMAIIGELLAILRLSEYLGGFNGTIMRLDISIVVIILYTCCVVAEINVLKTKISSGSSRGRIPPDLQKKRLFYMRPYTNYLSDLSVWWANWLVKLAHRQTIEAEDLGCLPQYIEGKRLLHVFNKIYRREQERCAKKNSNPSLWRVYWHIHYSKIISSTLSRLVYTLLNFASPFCIGGIVTYSTQYYFNDLKQYNSPFVTIEEFFTNGFILVLVASISILMKAVLWAHSFGDSVDIGISLNSAIQNHVYEKTLRLSSQSTDELSVGQTVNHIAVDGAAVQWFFIYFGFMVCNPIQAIIVCVWLFNSMGISGVIGASIVVLAVPFLLGFGDMQGKSHRRSLIYSDERLEKTSEVLHGIKLLKLYAWEELFSTGIKSIRNKEMKQKQCVGLYFLLSTIFAQSSPFVANFAMLAVYSKVNAMPLTPDLVFTALALTNLLFQPLFMIPILTRYLVEGLTSTKRLAHFLSLKEMSKYGDHSYISDNILEKDLYDQEDDTELKGKRDSRPLVQSITHHQYTSDVPSHLRGVIRTHTQSDIAIEIEDGSFSWDGNVHVVELNNINVTLRAGTLTIIVGKVGSGKSSLLSAILGEMYTITGSVKLYGKNTNIAYVAQKAWLQNASVRDNILFGEEFVAEKYFTVLDVCALNPDLQILPGGDLTEIGERGINLSGGQKHRISLARALYSNTDIVILDDPLSSLDVHVSEYVMVNAIFGLLRDQQRTVILVTHMIQHLEHADQVLVMEDGQIVQNGNMKEIQKQDIRLYRQWQEMVSEISESQSERSKETTVTRIETSTSTSFDLQRHINASIIAKEERPKGAVGCAIFLAYVRAMTVPLAVILFIAYLLEIACFAAVNLWISAWSQAGQDSLNKSEIEQELTVRYYLPRYAIFTSLVIPVAILFNVCFIAFFIMTAKKLFRKILYKVMHSPIRFFETTPVGRILNRFSVDMLSVDVHFWMTLSLVLIILISLFGTIVVNTIISPYFLLVMVPISVIIGVSLDFGVRLPRDLKRLDRVTLSPVLAYFTDTYVGSSTIRAFGAEQRFVTHMLDRIDANIVCQLYYATSIQWASFRINTIGMCLVLFVGVGALIASMYRTINPSDVGLAVTTGILAAQFVNGLMTVIVDLFCYVSGVERVIEYTKLDTEELQGSIDVPDSWPDKGSIDLYNVTVRYADELEPALTNINIHVNAGEKIGICGRTGSGKSSLTLTLLRMIDVVGGQITIDDIDISKVPLLTLRRRIAIIPQDPVIFCGTIRFNLDPENIYTDNELWDALEVAQLKDRVIAMDNKLGTLVTEDGDNFSAGQKQLFCLARAFLLKPTILIMDEATASIDFETDVILQKVVASAFADKTVLTIAHRISTILDSDFVMVLSDGQIIEWDTPHNLLKTKDSMFASMVNETI